MDTQRSGPADTGLRRFVKAEPGEVAAVVASFAMFFALLSAYYIIRPVRDEIGVTLGKDALQRLFTFVFFVMLALVPIFGFVAARFPRRLVLPIVYLFFTLNLFGFWLLLRNGSGNPWAAASFFVWGSVFNLFVVSLFWSLMAELWSTEEAKRLYGFISAGGTAGAFAGPVLTQGLVRFLAPGDLLLVAAGLLLIAMLASLFLRRLRSGETGNATNAAGGGILDGATKVFSDPLFARMALFVFLANIAGTFFYLEQSRLVAIAIPGSAERVMFFSGRDLVASIATFLIEVFGTARVLQRFGVTTALIALPVTAGIGTVMLGFDTTLWVVAAIMVAERVVSFSLANPAIKVIYTTASPDEKYKVQNFIDTVVFRGGDAASGWVYSLAGAGMGFATSGMFAVAMPIVFVWLWVAQGLGGKYRQRTAETG